MKSWKRIEPTVVSKVGFKTVVTKTFEMPDGRIKHWEATYREDWEGAAVLALTPDNKVIVVRQFRPGPEKIMDELPGGVVDEGEDSQAAAAREFTEETGYAFDSMAYLGAMYYDAHSNGTRHYFIATGCKPSKTGAKHGSDEFIELRLISIGQLLENSRTGRMTDPGAVLLAYDKLMEIKEGTHGQEQDKSS